MNRKVDNFFCLALPTPTDAAKKAISFPLYTRGRLFSIYLWYRNFACALSFSIEFKSKL